MIDFNLTDTLFLYILPFNNNSISMFIYLSTYIFFILIPVPPCHVLRPKTIKVILNLEIKNMLIIDDVYAPHRMH